MRFLVSIYSVTLKLYLLHIIERIPPQKRIFQIGHQFKNQSKSEYQRYNTRKKNVSELKPTFGESVESI